MAEQQDPRREQYEHARRSFEALRLEDRALFLVEETIATVAHGIEWAGRVLADEMEAAFRWGRRAEEPGTEEQETGQAASGRSRRRSRSRTSRSEPEEGASADNEEENE